MKKFLLVIFIGMVLAMNLYGVTKSVINYIETKNVENNINKDVATIVYME